MDLIIAILTAAEWWLHAGAVVAFMFLAIGIDRIDENARGAYIFRPLLVPGILLIWPLVLWRWFVLEKGTANVMKRYQPPRRAHGRMWIVFSILIPFVFVAGLLARQTWPVGTPAVQLSPPPGEAQH